MMALKGAEIDIAINIFIILTDFLTLNKFCANFATACKYLCYKNCLVLKLYVRP